MSLSTFGRANALLWLSTGATALAVASTPGVAAAGRRAFAFELRPYPGSLHQVAVITIANARVVGSLLLLAVAVAFVPRVRRVTDVAVAAVLASNVVVVGMAIGAYGRDAPEWLFHLPLEWGALAAAVTGYVECCRGEPERSYLAGVIAGVLVLAAAFTESYLTPQ